MKVKQVMQRKWLTVDDKGERTIITEVGDDRFEIADGYMPKSFDDLKRLHLVLGEMLTSVACERREPPF